MECGHMSIFKNRTGRYLRTHSLRVCQHYLQSDSLLEETQTKQMLPCGLQVFQQKLQKRVCHEKRRKEADSHDGWKSLPSFIPATPSGPCHRREMTCPARLRDTSHVQSLPLVDPAAVPCLNLHSVSHTPLLAVVTLPCDRMKHICLVH